MRDPATFATAFFTAIREGTGDSDSSWMAMHTFQVVEPIVIQDWAVWAVRNLGDMAITPSLLVAACLGPDGQPKLRDWLFETAWGQHVMAHCPQSKTTEAASAAVLAMVLLKLTAEDWAQIAEHMNRVPEAVEA